MLNRGLVIARNFEQPRSLEEKMEELRKLTQLKKAQVKEVQTYTENFMNDNKEVSANHQQVEQKKFEVEDTVVFNLSKKFTLKKGKLFEVRPEVTVKEFIKGILNSVEDYKVKKEIVSEETREKIESSKQNKKTLKLSLPKYAFFKFL